MNRRKSSFVLSSYRTNDSARIARRDSAEAIYDVAQDEANYAAIVNKPFNFSVETGENTDIVTFYEEGADYMYRQLDLLRDKIPDCFGIAIHHIKDWRALKN